MKKKFTDYTKLFMLIPAVIVLAALILTIAGHGLNLGIDFTGGSLLEYAVGEDFSTEDVVDILRRHGYTDAQVAKAASGDDGTGAMTNLQIRLSLTDLSDDMKKLVKQAADGRDHHQPDRRLCERKRTGQQLFRRLSVQLEEADGFRQAAGRGEGRAG